IGKFNSYFLKCKKKISSLFCKSCYNKNRSRRVPACVPMVYGLSIPLKRRMMPMAFSAAQADEIKVVSFNLRRDFGPQRKNRWETRKELAARLIEESNASIIGVQEFLPQMRRDLKGLLDGYSIFGRGRLSGKKPQNDEHADIIIKNK